MIAGKDSFKPGEAKNSWLTGTASWNYYAIVQYILGIQPQYDGIKVDPCIPKTWKGYEVQRKFRGAQYHISINNEHGVNKGVKSVILNGINLDGNLIPVQPKGSVNNVSVLMG